MRRRAWPGRSNWLPFTDNNTVYDMSPFDLITQMPVGIIDIAEGSIFWADGSHEHNVLQSFGGTVDVNNVATEMTLAVVCPADAIHAGDVIVLSNAGLASTGPYQGRWIVTDAVRSLFNVYSTLTLDLPGTGNLPAPLDEPIKDATSAPTNTTPTLSYGVTPNGSRQSLVAAAHWACDHQNCYVATEGASRQDLAGSAKVPSGLWYPPAANDYAPLLDHGVRPETRGIVIHVNAGGTYASVVSAFKAGGFTRGVGAHFEVGSAADGGVAQFLSCERLAYHAGNANGYSLGVEHAGEGASAAEWLTGHGNMLQTSATLVGWLLKTYSLGPPVVNTTDPPSTTDGVPPSGNLWPHNLGMLCPQPFTDTNGVTTSAPENGCWGGHSCPDGPDGLDHFPWSTYTPLVEAAYTAASPGTVVAASGKGAITLYGTPSDPTRCDCSGFVELLYQAAGCNDPSGLRYQFLGDTASLWKNGKLITERSMQPGDLCFYGWDTPGVKPQHVAMYVGGTQCVSMNPHPPALEPLNLGPSLPLVGIRSYIS